MSHFHQIWNSSKDYQGTIDLIYGVILHFKTRWELIHFQKAELLNVFQGKLVGRSFRKKCSFIQQAFIEYVPYARNYTGDVEMK